jgi:hypothetical protein
LASRPVRLLGRPPGSACNPRVDRAVAERLAMSAPCDGTIPCQRGQLRTSNDTAILPMRKVGVPFSHSFRTAIRRALAPIDSEACSKRFLSGGASC